MSVSRSQDPEWPAALSAEDSEALARLRQEIDTIDRGILTRLNERARRVGEVGAIKRSSGSGVYRAGRERDLIDALVGENPGPFPSTALPAVISCRSSGISTRGSGPYT